MQNDYQELKSLEEQLKQYRVINFNKINSKTESRLLKLIHNKSISIYEKYISNNNQINQLNISSNTKQNLENYFNQDVVFSDSQYNSLPFGIYDGIAREIFCNLIDSYIRYTQSRRFDN